MGWKRTGIYAQPMATPRLSSNHRKELYEKFAEIDAPPIIPMANWDRMDWYKRRNTHVKKYQRLLLSLQNASAALKEFLNESIHKQERQPEKLKQQLIDIEIYEQDFKEWQHRRQNYTDHIFHNEERNKDDDYVAQTGRCCGTSKYGGIRMCKRRATNGNFCFQHIDKAQEYRR
jgi:hypothetical protein